MKSSTALAITLLIAGCSKHSGNTTTADNQLSDCQTSWTSETTPVQEYASFASCMKAGDTSKALKMFIVAGVYGTYDRERVADPSAAAVLLPLKLKVLDPLTPDQRKDLKSASDALLHDKDALSSLCAEFRKIGPPTYNPEYMLSHGLSNFGSGGPTGLKQIDSAAVFNASLSRYAHCP